MRKHEHNSRINYVGIGLKEFNNFKILYESSVVNLGFKTIGIILIY